MKSLIYTKDAAEILGVDPRTVMSYVRRGLLACTEGEKRGKGQTMLFSREDVEDLHKNIGNIPDLEEKLDAARKELKDEYAKVRGEIYELHRDAQSYKMMFDRRSVLMELCASAIESIGLLALRPFTEREIEILKDLASGIPNADVAKKHNLSRERVRQIASRAIRLLVKRIPDQVADQLESMRSEIDGLKATIERLNADNDRLRLAAKKKGASEVLDGSVYNRPIQDLNLSVRSENCLRAVGVETIGELCSLKPKELLGWRNFGHQSLLDVTNKLASMGLALGTMPHADNLSYLYHD